MVNCDYQKLQASRGILSIITINLNNVDGLKKTAKSVVEQTYRDMEWIVIDGGSTDGSKEFIESCADQISYWVSEPDAGVYNAMNKGIKHAKGKYIQFLNSGDCLLSNDILEEVFATEHDADVLYTDCYLVENDRVKEERRYPDVMSLRELLDINLVHNGMFFKRELFEEELYDETLKISSDLKFNIKKVLENKSFKHVPVFSIAYDVTGISASQFDLLLKEQKSIVEAYISPSIMKDVDKLRGLLKDDCLERIQANRENSRLYHKLVTANLQLIGLLERMGIK